MNSSILTTIGILQNAYPDKMIFYFEGKFYIL